jgi:hypothetical protein
MTSSEPSQTPTENNPQSHPEWEQRVRERAYALWEAEGRAQGRDEEYWHRAQELIDDETRSAYPPAHSRGNRS